MYFDELSFMQQLRLINQSRYLFLEFIPEFSLILVANQGGHDLHIFKLLSHLDISLIDDF